MRKDTDSNVTAISHVFFVTSQGYAADHWYSWFVKALNAHPEILAYLANEGSRPKYFSERSRAERPDLIRFAQFLADVGMTYTAIGDCYSYRAPHMTELQREFGEAIRAVNLLRHPYVWLRFYVQWRCTNMRMPNGETGPLDQEWNATQHELFKALGLESYTKDDVEIWASYQGMHMLNAMVSDMGASVQQVRLEHVVENPDSFRQLVAYLTHDRVEYDETLIDLVYSWIWTPFRWEPRMRVVPAEEYAAWGDWRKVAFSRIVRKETIEMFREYGYEF